jgi:hypothetical protein
LRIQRRDGGKQFSLGHAARQDFRLAAQAQLPRHLDLASDVDVAGRIVADQNHGQARRTRQVIQFARDIVEKDLSVFMPVDDFRSHGTSVREWCPGARQIVPALPDGPPSERQLRRGVPDNGLGRRKQ